MTSSGDRVGLLPADDYLPELGDLVDPARALTVVRRCAGLSVAWEARVRYLEYVPGRSFLVLLRVRDGDAEHEVVASRGRLTGTGTGTSSAAGPLRLERFPQDSGLPLLADRDRLLAVLGLDPGVAMHRLAWLPQQRAVLRVGGEIVKLVHGAEAARHSWANLGAAAGRLPVPRRLRADLAAGVVVQSNVPGRALGGADALDFAAAAGSVLGRLHGGSPDGLVARHAADLLAQCRPVTALVGVALPGVRDRVGALAERLACTAPASRLVPSHGDFSVDQLIAGAGDTLTVVDTDTLCRAPAGLDLGAFAANLVSGREGDLADARVALTSLVAGYGARPPDLDWWLAACLLRRLDRGLRRWKRDWPARTERLLGDAETVAAQLGR